MHFASSEVQSHTGRLLAQALQYKCEVSVVKREVWSAKCGVWRVKCEVQSVEWRLWSVECEVCSVKCGV